SCGRKGRSGWRRGCAAFRKSEQLRPGPRVHVMSEFELFVATRYLRARRKEKMISVITVISVVGVAAGVAALIISLAVNNGFQNTLQRNMLAATAHVNILDKDPGQGIEDWRNLI